MARAAVTTANPSALSFDGTDDSVNCGDVNSAEGIDEITLAGWFLTTDQSKAIQQMITKGRYYNSASSWGMLYDGTNKRVTFSVSDSRYAYINQTLTSNVWHHILISYSKTSSQILFYVNGSSVSPAVNAGTFITIPETIKNVIIANGDAGSALWQGNIDQVRIWNRALTPTEIAQDYRGVRVASGLIGEWLFNEGAGTKAFDSASSNHGTISGATYTTGVDLPRYSPTARTVADKTIVVPNGDFESGTGSIDGAAGWIGSEKFSWYNQNTIGGGAALIVSYDSDVKKTGEKSLKIVQKTGGSGKYSEVNHTGYANGSYNALAKPRYFRIKPNARYKISTWVKGENLGTGVVWLQWRRFTETGTVGLESAAPSPAGSFDWTLLTYTFTSEATALYLGIAIQTRQVDTDAIIYVDDITLELVGQEREPASTSRTVVS
jgi:hypothetical protein